MENANEVLSVREASELLNVPRHYLQAYLLVNGGRKIGNSYAIKKTELPDIANALGHLRKTK